MSGSGESGGREFCSRVICGVLSGNAASDFHILANLFLCCWAKTFFQAGALKERGNRIRRTARADVLPARLLEMFFLACPIAVWFLMKHRLVTAIHPLSCRNKKSRRHSEFRSTSRPIKNRYTRVFPSNIRLLYARENSKPMCCNDSPKLF